MRRPHLPLLLSVLIPVYNEHALLRAVVGRVLTAQLPAGVTVESVLVDDASTDGSGELCDKLAQEHPAEVTVFHQERNMGKGAALRRAIAGMRGGAAVFQDADLEYDPEDFALMLEPLLAGAADVVYGTRFTKYAPPSMSRKSYLANRFLTWLSNRCTGLKLSDMETCYKMFRAEVLRGLPLRADRFNIEPEITALVARHRCVVTEVPVSYHARDKKGGKKIGWRDGLSAVRTILRHAVFKPGRPAG